MSSPLPPKSGNCPSCQPKWMQSFIDPLFLFFCLMQLIDVDCVSFCSQQFLLVPLQDRKRVASDYGLSLGRAQSDIGATQKPPAPQRRYLGRSLGTSDGMPSSTWRGLDDPLPWLGRSNWQLGTSELRSQGDPWLSLVSGGNFRSVPTKWSMALACSEKKGRYVDCSCPGGH